MAGTVLVVDDDPLTRRVVQHYLEHAGYRVISTGSGREAMELARQELPQLILLDMMLPDMDGPTVLEQLQKTQATTAIPVIRISGNAELLNQNEKATDRLVLTNRSTPSNFLRRSRG